MIYLASALGAIAVGLSLGIRSSLVRLRLSTSDGIDLSYLWLCPFLIASLIGLERGLIGFILSTTLVSVAVFSLAQLNRSRIRKREAELQARISEAIQSLAADLGSGLSPQQSLIRVANEVEVFQSAASAARWGGDIPEALRASHQGLRDLAAAWVVGEESGSGLAPTLADIARSHEAKRDVEREIALSLSPARATAVTLSLLPIFALGLGMLMGYQPLSLITSTLFGALSFSIGSAFAVLGLWWVDRLAERAGRC